MRIELLIIDPQNDFCHKDGALFVPGATEDMGRVAEMIDRIGHKLYDIHSTLDSHRLIDIAHPIFWINSEGKHPGDYDFTIITAADVRDGKWAPTNPAARQRATAYVEALEDNARYPLCVWPPHCLIGSWGHNVIQSLFDSFKRWEEQNFAQIDFVTKGSNPWTEHYSAVQADVPDPQDPTTSLNRKFIDELANADEILLAGEARSHCLANTVRDIANNFGDDSYIKKLVLLTDATTDVADPPGTTMFTDMGEGFVSEMVGRGMQLSTTTEYLK